MEKIKKNLTIGDNFELAGMNWKILDITDKGYMCLAEQLSKHKMFDEDSNKWETSSLRAFLNTTIYEKISNAIGTNNVVSFERDCISLDGQTEYGKCEDNVSLLTLDEYRKYRKHIPNSNNWWWLLTPWSIPCNGAKWISAVVSPAGDVYYFNCSCVCGVRPFCIFSSSLFESEG